MQSKKKIEKARKANFKKSSEIKGLPIKGHDFSKKFSFEKFLKSYKSTGFQASHLAIATDIIKEMQGEKAVVFLAFNSNMVSSGLRELIAFLVKEKKVDALITTAGGVEEDIIKCFGSFLLGSYGLEGKKLREKGLNRIGNILVPNNRYIEFEKFMQNFLEKIYTKQLKENKAVSASQIIHLMGKEVKDKNSIYYWASKNNIPCYCPALTDGAIGDNIFFFKQKHPEFQVDIADDMKSIGLKAINAKKTGVIVLGGGFVKHHACNANLLRDGADYAVFITTETEEGGSDSGARPDEAVSWGKIRPNGRMVKVYGDATIIFPLIVAGTLI